MLYDFVHACRNERPLVAFCFPPHVSTALCGKGQCVLGISTKPALTVLIVEDEGLTRTAIADHLRDAGFVVLEAESGEAALAKRDANGAIHVVFTDIRLGGKVNGWDVAEAFRAWNPDISVLYTSGNSIAPPRNVERSHFFEKPYVPEAIVEACRRLCDVGQQ